MNAIVALSRKAPSFSRLAAAAVTKSRFLSSSALPSLISREITEEIAIFDPEEIPEDLADLKSSISDKWTIVEGDSTAATKSGATIKMYRKDATPNGSKVSLTFHCQDTIDNEEESASLFGEEEEEGDENSPPVQFMVTVSKAGKDLKINCISEDAKASVDGMIIAPTEASLDEIGDLYRGPVLDDLPEDVRVGLDDYLVEDCGIDEDVAAFVAMYSDHREQAEYIAWLKDLKKIVE